MNTRLTPELERRIRQGLLHQWEEGETAISALLAELDHVRKERDEDLRLNCDLKQRLCNHCLREVDDPTAAKLRTQELESQVEALSRTLRTVKELIRPPQTVADLIEASKQIREALREQITTMPKFNLFVDHERWEWNAPTITGEQMRELVGIPDTAQVFQKVQGEPDHEIHRATVVDVSDGKQRFSTQSKGSYAGALREQTK